MNRPFLLGTAALFALAPLACGSTQKTATGASSSMAAAPGSNATPGPSVDRSKCDTSGKQVTTTDTNQDKKPDVWKLYAAGGQFLACKQVDLNHDGSVDIVYYYDASGVLTMEEFDLDFDRKFDMATYYQNGRRIRDERDHNFDARPDYWKFYEDEKLVRIERDADFNGNVDEWSYYEGGRLDRIGYDTSGSGRVDKWDRAPENEETPPAEGAVPAGNTPPAPAAPPPPLSPPPAAAPAAAAPAKK